MSLTNWFISGLLVVGIFQSTNGNQQCYTPSGDVGRCVAFESCQSFYNLLKNGQYTMENLKLVKNSWCTNSTNARTICCPSSGNTRFRRQISNNDLSRHRNAKLLDLQQCGIKSVFTYNIVNGYLTELFEYPWMAMLRTLTSDNQLQMHCGGTLISNRYVLTAAHCLRTLQGVIRIHSVVLGEYDTSTNPDCVDSECSDPIQEILVEQIIPHPNFILANAKNDIGLVRLRRNVRFSDSVRPICLPYTTETQNLSNKQVIVTGWGGTVDQQSSNVLLQTTLNVIPNNECSTVYEDFYNGRLTIDNNFMCLFSDQSDTCHGDSGGPAGVMASTKFGPRMFQYGVVSAGTRNCGQNNGIPGLYTRVSSYVEWILDNISN